MTRYDGSNQRARNGALGGQYRNEWVSQVEILALRTKEREKEKKNGYTGPGPLPSFGAPKACSSWEQERPRFAREGGQGGETRDEEGALHLVHGIDLSGLQASTKSRFLF